MNIVDSHLVRSFSTTEGGRQEHIVAQSFEVLVRSNPHITHLSQGNGILEACYNVVIMVRSVFVEYGESEAWCMQNRFKGE